MENNLELKPWHWYETRFGLEVALVHHVNDDDTYPVKAIMFSLDLIREIPAPSWAAPWAINAELLAALERICGSNDPLYGWLNGWRGTLRSTETLFECEYCHEVHEDIDRIPHKEDCTILFARAAIAKAKGGAA